MKPTIIKNIFKKYLEKRIYNIIKNNNDDNNNNK